MAPMTNTMTPSEIADWLEGLARILRAEAQHSATVNARWREHRWEPSEGLAKGCEQAAATIRAQAEQLKIATEALEAIKITYPEDSGAHVEASCALASMGEVGRDR